MALSLETLGAHAPIQNEKEKVSAYILTCTVLLSRLSGDGQSSLGQGQNILSSQLGELGILAEESSGQLEGSW